MTARAAQRVNEIVSGEPNKNKLRVSVNGGGCSGFQYDFELTSEQTDNDIVVEKDGATILIDEISLMYIEGSQIDFVDSLIGASFQINNPNATASCGCGTSFTI